MGASPRGHPGFWANKVRRIFLNASHLHRPLEFRMPPNPPPGFCDYRRAGYIIPRGGLLSRRRQPA